MRHFILYAAVMAATGLTSCGARQQALTESELNARVDSLVAERVETLNQHYMEDLEKRMAIEVKVKADSIVAARENTGR